MNQYDRQESGGAAEMNGTASNATLPRIVIALLVIFAVMAGGQLFGFVGVLLALPAAAVLAVLMRHAKQRWLESPLYLQGRPPRRRKSKPAE